MQAARKEQPTRSRGHRPRGWQVTPRDVEILGWIGRHGVVTAEQVARRFFSRDAGAVGQRAAYDRLRKLEELGLVYRSPTFWKEPHVLRLTTAGIRLAANGVGSSNLVLAEVRHTLAVVDLLESLARDDPTAELVTEREIRGQRHRAIRDGVHKVGHGRIPDGMLRFANGDTVAVELDLTSKRSRDIERTVRAYSAERIAAVWWFVPSEETAERVRQAARKERATDLIEVQVWKG